MNRGLPWCSRGSDTSATDMKHLLVGCAACVLLLAAATLAVAQTAASPSDPVAELVGRLDLERYKATIKGLTQFGDRLEGTDRNRAAVDWIEAQLKSYGCPTGRIKYDYVTPQRGTGGRGRAGGATAGGQRGR